MDFLPGGTSLALYVLTAVCGLTLFAMWITSERSGRNAGFASKSHLKRQLSAKSALKAKEIRPSLTRGDDGRTKAVSLTKNRQAGS